MILTSIYELAEATTRPVAYEDLVVIAWKLFPCEFGLRGYADQHPDSADFRTPLQGALRREGYVRMQRGKFALTERGLAAAERLHEPSPAVTTELARVRSG